MYTEIKLSREVEKERRGEKERRREQVFGLEWTQQTSTRSMQERKLNLTN